MVKVKELRTEELNKKPEYENLIPRPIIEEYTALKEDIRQNGIKRPILINREKTILDGYTRYQIAKELGIERMPTMTKDFANGSAEKYEVITLNLHRRHLTTSQKVWLGLALEEVEKEQAKQRMSAGGKGVLFGKQEEGVEIFPPLSETGETKPKKKKGKARDLAAEKVGISGRTLNKGRRIVEAAETDPEVKEAWEKSLEGKKTFEAVYTTVKKKEKTLTPGTGTEVEKEPQPELEEEKTRPTIKEETVIANTELKGGQQTLDQYIWLYEDDKGNPFLKIHDLTLDAKQTKQLYKFLEKHMEKA